MTASDDVTYRDVFGLRAPEERALASKIVDALEKIDPRLVPREAHHAFLAEIVEGLSALPKLLSLVESGGGRARFDALDAVAHIFARQEAGAPKEALARLHALLARAGDGDTKALLLKTIAIGRDDAFLRAQLGHLGDDDPAVVASAAQLTGFGRYRPAVPVLRALVSPARAFAAPHAIWALGEIGSADAVPELHFSIEKGFRVVDCATALGKIGQLSSVGHLVPLLLQGTPDQRDAGYRGLAMLLDKNRDVATAVADLGAMLTGIIETQLQRDEVQQGHPTRFFMALCLARLGKKLEPARMRALLGLSLDDEVTEMVSYFLNRGRGRK